MEGLIPDLKEMETLYKGIVEKETDEELKNFANETLEEVLPKIKEELAEYVKGKEKVNREAFKQEYDKLYEGNGHGGDYEILKANSLPEDEAALKALREVILQRNSDEAFYDYEAVNRIILMNRCMTANTDFQKGK